MLGERAVCLRQMLCLGPTGCSEGGKYRVEPGKGGGGGGGGGMHLTLHPALAVGSLPDPSSSMHARPPLQLRVPRALQLRRALLGVLRPPHRGVLGRHVGIHRRWKPRKLARKWCHTGALQRGLCCVAPLARVPARMEPAQQLPLASLAPPSPLQLSFR